MTTTTEKLQAEMLKRILTALDNMGCKYTITDANGAMHKNTPEKPVKKRGIDYPVGEIRNYYMPFLKDLGIGQIAEVPYDKYPPHKIQSGVASYCSSAWGNKTYTTSRDRERNCLHVLRTGGL